MQMKFDKDLVLKHKFWIVLALCVPFSIAAIFILTTRVSGQIAEQHKKIVGTLKAVGSAPKVPMRDINEAKFAAMVEQAKKSIVWARAWDEQKHLFVWPKEVEDRFDFQNGLFVYEIAIEAKQEDKEAAPEPKAEPKEEKDEEKKEEKGDPNPLSGTITERAADYLMVKGTNGKEYKFRRTEKIKFTGLPEGKESWLHIPQGAKATVSYNRGKYFLHDGLTNSEQPAYMKFGVYHSQIEPIIRQVDPVGPDGKGVVQLKDWAYIEGKRPPSSPFLQYVEAWQPAGDMSDEAWLAQEDLWIYKELYRVIREANDQVGKFEGKLDDPEDKKKHDPKKVYNFKNPYWDLKLVWDSVNNPTNLQVTITNLQNRRQKLDDVKLRIRFQRNPGFESDVIVLGGEPLQPHKHKGDTVTLQRKMPENPLRTGIYSIEQVLTWESSAVKRIDEIVIGAGVGDSAHSHRTYPDGLRPYKKEDKPAEEVAVGVEGGPMPKFAGGQDQGKGTFKRTKHNLLKDRYVEVTSEARRIPIAVALIVDQDHIDRVETAFGNSKLRFLMTQVLLNRYPGSLRPKEGENLQNPFVEGGVRFQPQMFRKGPMGPMGPMGFPKFAEDPAGGQDAAAGVAAGGDEMQSNVEMVIYGIITIYERYPAALNKTTGAPPVN